jgi:DUF4097 and DUF4098 domain-containing protein YvlB
MARRIFAVAAIALFVAAPTFAAEKEFNRSFDVPAGGRLKVDAEGGSVAVTGSNGSKVVVHIQASGSDERLEKLNLSADRDSEGVIVVAKQRDKVFSWFGGSVKVNVSVEVPKNYNVDLRTSGGNIEVRQLNGTATGHTSGGRINLESIQGPVQMRTSGGSVSARSLRGETQLQTSGGSISAHEIEGGLRAHTSGGTIRIERASGMVDAQTSGGSINIELTGENQGIVAKTSGGSITLRVPGSIAGTLNASTSGGRVSSDLAMTNSSSDKSSLRGTINGGGPEILARSSGGSISVTKL